MTPGLAVLLLLAALYAVVAIFGAQATKALLYFAWAAMALWTAGTVVWAGARLLLG